MPRRRPDDEVQLRNPGGPNGPYHPLLEDVDEAVVWTALREIYTVCGAGLSQQHNALVAVLPYSSSWCCQLFGIRRTISGLLAQCICEHKRLMQCR